MFEPDIVPECEIREVPHGGSCRLVDDIETPPEPTVSSQRDVFADDSHDDTVRRADSKRFSPFIGPFIFAGVLLAGAWFTTRNSGLEQQHANWQHVAAASSASDNTPQQIVRVDQARQSTAVRAIEVASVDADRMATQQVRFALRRNDLVTATAMLQAAQQLPTASQNIDVRPPVLTADSALMKALKSRRSQLYEIELFDCCHEDGDVIELLVNGESFAMVPILHNGSKLAIPLHRGQNTVTVRAAKDGAGGVTVSFRTSRGDYFARCMDVGQEHQMGVVVQ